MVIISSSDHMCYIYLTLLCPGANIASGSCLIREETPSKNLTPTLGPERRQKVAAFSRGFAAWKLGFALGSVLWEQGSSSQDD